MTWRIPEAQFARDIAIEKMLEPGGMTVPVAGSRRSEPVRGIR